MRRVGLAHRLRRLGRPLRRVAGLVPVTPLGVIVLAGAAWILRTFAYGSLDLVLLVVGWGAIGLAALSVVAVVAGAVVVAARLRADAPAAPLTLEAGVPTPTGRRLPSIGWLPFTQVRWAWESADGAGRFPPVTVETRRGPDGRGEVVEVGERCELLAVRRRATVEDVFGLARVHVGRVERTAVQVLPHLGALHRAEVLQSLAGGDEQPHPMGLVDGDRVDLRRYVPGDPARFIHWKVFGRTRKLVVRTPERSLSRARRTVAYFVAGEGDEASAAVARLAILRSAFGDDWTFSADGAHDDTSHPDEAVAMVVRSREAAGRGAEGLRAFVGRAERGGPATLVVFAPAARGPWLARVTEVAVRSPRPVRVLIGVDGLEARPPATWWSRLVAAADAPAGTDARGVEEIVRALRAARCEVTVHDRPSGRLLGAEARRRALERLERRGGGRRLVQGAAA